MEAVGIEGEEVMEREEPANKLYTKTKSEIHEDYHKNYLFGLKLMH